MNKDKTIPKLWDNKVDKGGYTGTAQNLKSEIDSKVSKNGDTLSGLLRIESDNSCVIFDKKYQIGHNKTYEHMYMFNGASDTQMCLYDNGNTSIDAKNLKTSSKEVIGAINELYNQKIDKNSNSNLTCGSIRVKSQTLDVWANNNPALRCYNEKGDYLSMIGVDGTATILWNGISEKQLRLNSDGSVSFYAANLNTNSKDVIGAINEVNGNKLNTTGGTLTGPTKFKSYLDIEYNVGIRSNTSSGTLDYVLYIDAADRVHVGYAGNRVVYLDGQTIVNGTVTARDWVTSSDIRLKENIQKIENPYKLIDNVNGYYYNFKEDKEQQIRLGVLAQELEKTVPEAIYTDSSTGLKSVSYMSLIPILLECVKEQKKEIDEMKSK